MNLVGMVQGINHVLLETTIASSTALVVVLLLRQRLRAMFGASVAYAGWWLLPVASMAVLLPAAATDTGMIPVVHRIAAMPMQVVVASAEPGIRYAQWLCVAWLSGAVLALFYFMRQQRRFRATLGRLQARETGLQQAEAVAGLPAAIGWIKPVVVLPADFDTRYSVEQRGLMLAHEQAHIRHGDLQANAAYLALRCLFWFNPLIHLAAAAFRHDQELACDQRVIARHPQSRRAYGEAMFHTQLAAQPMPLGCPWGLTHPLKERIEMLKQPIPSSLRWFAGSGLVVLLTFGVGLAAWAVQPKTGSASGKISIHQTDLSLQEAAEKIAGRVGLRLGNPEVLRSDQRFTLGLDDEPVNDALASLVDDIGLTPKISNGEVMFEQVVRAEPVRANNLPPPEYPEEAMKQGIRGEIMMIVEIAPDGSVVDATVEKSQPAGVFDAAALKAVRKWKFNVMDKPDGKQATRRVRVPIYFEPPKAPKKTA